MEVHNVLHCHHRRIKLRPQVICTENFVKSGHLVFEICEQTDRETDMLIAIFHTHTEGNVINAVTSHSEVHTNNSSLHKQSNIAYDAKKSTFVPSIQMLTLELPAQKGLGCLFNHMHNRQSTSSEQGLLQSNQTALQLFKLLLPMQIESFKLKKQPAAITCSLHNAKNNVAK